MRRVLPVYESTLPTMLPLSPASWPTAYAVALLSAALAAQAYSQTNCAVVLVVQRVAAPGGGPPLEVLYETQCRCADGWPLRQFA